MGDFGLTYDYFMSLTPKLWAYLCQGIAQREDRRMQKLAWQTAHIMNSSGNYKKPVTPDALIGRQPKDTKPIRKMDFGEVGKWVKS